MPNQYTGPSSLVDRFWVKVKKTDSCWLWRGATNSRGYGRINRDGRYQSFVAAHRIAWELTYGPIPPGMGVCHRCDVPLCVRPDHLFLGTHADNMRDMAAKRRGTLGDRNPVRLYPERVQRGETCSWSKLTEDQVRAIRSRYVPRKVTLQMLADEYGVTDMVIHKIIRRKSWAHVD